MVEIIASVIIVSMIFVLIRPGSKGPTVVMKLGEAFSSIILTAIG